MKNLGLLICSLLILSGCGSGSSNQEIREGSVKADTRSQDTIQVEKSKAPNFPNDEDEGAEKMDEIVNRAKNQSL